jgi:hypothetical protein
MMRRLMAQAKMATRLIAACGIAAHCAAPATAQQWWPVRGFERNGDYEGSVRGVLAPTGEYAGELWIAGEFEHVQGIRTGGVARYRGGCYEPVGVPPAQAEGLVQFEGDIYVYGAFTEIDGRPVTGIARWDGAQWVALGAGVNGQVIAACEFAGELVCVGTFTEADGVPALRIAAWNGLSWRPWPQGLQSGFPQRVRSIGGVLTMCGTSLRTPTIQSASLLQWNGTAWVQVGGATNRVQDIAYFGGSLIATTWFGPVTGAPAGVVRWTGSAWEALGQTVQNADALTIYDGRLLASGITGSWGSALWDGTAWTPFSPARSRLLFIPPAEFAGGLTVDGFDVELPSGEHEYLGVRSDLDLAIFDVGSELVGVGSARVGRSDRDAGRFWRHVNGAWVDAGPQPPHVYFDRITRVASDLYSLAYSYLPQGGNGQNLVLRWNGTDWTPYAAVEPVPGRQFVAVSAVKEIGGEVIVGGSFSAIEGVAANGIARQVGDTWEPLGAGVDGWVGAIAEFDGQLVVGLQHESIPAPGAVLVLAWNGTQFVPLGSGLPVSASPAAIREFRVYDGTLYTAGQFITSDGSAIESLARWDGHAWSQVGGGLDGTASFPALVWTLDEFDGRLVVGGHIKVRDLPGEPGTGLWDGVTWSSLPSGIEGETREAYVIGDDLYVTGNLWFAGGEPISGLARFGPTPPPHPADLSASTDPADPSYGVPDGVVDATDFFFFLDQFQQSNFPICDIAGDSDPSSPCYGVPDGIIDISDFFAYLDRFVN